MKNRKLQIFDIRRKAVFSDKEKAPSIYINSLNYKMAKCFKLIGYLKSIKTLLTYIYIFIHLYGIEIPFSTKQLRKPKLKVKDQPKLENKGIFDRKKLAQ